MNQIQEGFQTVSLSNHSDVTAGSSSLSVNYLDLVRKYWLLALLFVILGAAGGFLSVVYQTPVYRARVILEVLNDRSRNPMMQGPGISSIDIETQITLLRGTSFVRTVVERMQNETVPPAPVQNDIFSKLRTKLKAQPQEPVEIMREALQRAVQSYTVRPINETRLIEISCDSTSPDIAAAFVNTLANEFADQSNLTEAQSMQRAQQSLLGQLEEAKLRYQEAEERLQQFVAKNGVVFSEQDTLADSKLRQLQAELAAVQAERISKQSRLDLLTKTPPEQLVELIEDANLQRLQAKISELRATLTELQRTMTPAHYKVIQATAALQEAEAALRREVENIIARVRTEYEAAQRKENLLSAAYSAQSRQVVAQVGKMAEYNSLKREAAIARQTHEALMLQANQGSLNGFASSNVMRVVEPTGPPAAPYKPRPSLNIAFGCVFGLFAAAGVGFLKEVSDRSVKRPGIAPQLLQVPEVGVIPAVSLAPSRKPFRLRRLAAPSIKAEVEQEDILAAAAKEDPLFTEAFHGAAAFLLGSRGATKSLIITSPNSGEGKTTISANLGIALAQAGRRVVLVDGDLRRPTLHRTFKVKPETTLLSLLQSDSISPQKIDQSIVSTEHERLSLLGNIEGTSNPVPLLHKDFVRQIFRHLEERFDIVLVDTPPVLLFADARILGRLADGVLLVLRSGVTDQLSAGEAQSLITENGITVLGTVLNDWKLTKDKAEYYYRYQNQG